MSEQATIKYKFPPFPSSDGSDREEWPTFKSVNVFTPEECASVIEICSKFPARDSTIQNDAGSVYTSSKRKGVVRWIPYLEPTKWIFEKVGAVMGFMNFRNWHFDLDGFDALQFTEYGPGDHFEWHRDMGAKDTMHRKLSSTIALNSTDEYKGGGVEVWPDTKLLDVTGTMHVFSSFDFHRALPVEEGKRYALVCWAMGPVFK